MTENPWPFSRTTMAGLSWALSIALIAFMFVYAANGEYLWAMGHAFFALMNLDAGRVQWRKRDTGGIA